MKIFKNISLIAILILSISNSIPSSIAQTSQQQHNQQSLDKLENQSDIQSDIYLDNEKNKSNPEEKIIADYNQQPLLQFSQTPVKDTAQITQLTIMDKSQLAIAGVKEESIYQFVHQFSEHAKNIFYANSMAGGRIIYGVIIKPSPENALIYAKQHSIEPTQTNLDKICRDEPTNCSLTSISNFHNGIISPVVLNQFDKDMYNNNSEIFWHNYKSPGEIKFFFEISLKNTI